ncbi:MAG: O-methyltransferase [Candidatus Cyclobacteriaceae bacterium M2_1C_046]
MDTLFRIKKFITYWLNEVNEHSLHSPFLYDLYTKVIISDSNNSFPEYERLREKLLKDPTVLSYNDPGAGSSSLKRQVRVKDLAKVSLSTKKYSLLYYRMIRFFQPEIVVELGTSLGINALYMSEGEKQVYTFEGAQSLITLAQSHISQLRRKNIKMIAGDINHTLPNFIIDIKKLPFVFFDANHTYEATLKYFDLCKTKADKNSIFIFDDIYWSEEMGKAWEKIKTDPSVIVTFDLYKCGIVLFNTDLNRQHLALKF